MKEKERIKISVGDGEDDNVCAQFDMVSTALRLQHEYGKGKLYLSPNMILGLKMTSTQKIVEDIIGKVKELKTDEQYYGVLEYRTKDAIYYSDRIIVYEGEYLYLPEYLVKPNTNNLGRENPVFGNSLKELDHIFATWDQKEKN